MKIGISQLVLPEWSLDATLDLCQEAGYEALELVFTEEHDPDFDLSSREIEQVHSNCISRGIEISSIIGRRRDRGNLLSPDVSQQERGISDLERAAEIAGILDAGAVLLHPGRLTPEGTYQEAWERLIACLKKVIPAAEKNSVRIGLENVGNYFLLSAKEMTEFIDQIGSPWIGAYLDTANLMMYGYTEHWIRSLKDRIVRVHLKDYKRRERVFVDLMDGDTDWPGIMKLLMQVGYKSNFIHEVEGDRDTQIKMADRMRKILSYHVTEGK